MARAKMKVDRLEVESFSTGGKAAVLDRPAKPGKEAPVALDTWIETGCYSDQFGHTDYCDTRQQCSEACLAATNVCGACG